ncbi:MAG: hypothetical protein RLZZ620_927, partial [Pseudomonadota bacterium]
AVASFNTTDGAIVPVPFVAVYGVQVVPSQRFKNKLVFVPTKSLEVWM